MKQLANRIYLLCLFLSVEFYKCNDDSNLLIQTGDLGSNTLNNWTSLKSDKVHCKMKQWNQNISQEFRFYLEVKFHVKNVWIMLSWVENSYILSQIIANRKRNGQKWNVGRKFLEVVGRVSCLGIDFSFPGIGNG